MENNIILWQKGNSFTINTLNDFNKMYYSYIVFSYKKNFDKINNSNISEDTGWGCMLRCGQMILYQGIKILTNEDEDVLIDNFKDNNKKDFSIHKLCDQKKKLGLNINDWIGPHTITYLLKKTLEISNYNDKISISIFENNTIFKNYKINKKKIIFIPLRLGISSIEIIYYNYIFILFTYEKFIGFLGGVGNRAYYFIGIDSNLDLYYLDPHFTQDVNKEIKYKMHNIKKINIKEIDPNLSLCFCIENQKEYDILLHKISYEIPNTFISVTENNCEKKIHLEDDNDWLNIVY